MNSGRSRRRLPTVLAFGVAVSFALISNRPLAALPRPKVTVTRLRWDGLENPLGIYRFSPRLSWVVISDGRGQRQSAYQVLVASSVGKLQPGRADLWDSGRVDSGESVNIKYGGPPLQQRQKGYWAVRVWDQNGHPSPFSQRAWWEMTPVEEEVEGEMIGGAPPREGGARAEAVNADSAVSYLRKTFTATGAITKARLFASAEGAYEIHVNGHRVGDRVLTPGWVGYRRWRRTLFQTYDVTALLRKGENVIGAIAAGAWCTATLTGGPPECGTDPGSVMVVLELTGDTGAVETVRSDQTWKVHGGPIVSSHLYHGESYDSRLEMPGWDGPGFDDRDWGPAHRYDQHELNPFHDLSPPITVAETRAAVRVTEPGPHRYVFDLGQNIVGWAQLRVAGARGTTVVLRFAEGLNPDGTLYTANLGSAQATDRYVLRGGGKEVWEPHFTVHGFRYVEVTGLASPPPVDAIKGRVVHSVMPETGGIETSDARLNRLIANIDWSQKGAFLGVPLRGPQRDERLGSLLDGQLFATTACLNRDVQGIFRKWIDDMRDSQRNGDAFAASAPRVNDVEGGPGAGDAGVIIPWASVLCYADRQVTDTFLPAMTRWVDLIHKENPGLLWTRRTGANLGDSTSATESTDKTLMATAFFAHSADLLARTFRFMGKDYAEYAFKYENLFEGIKGAFARAFVRPDGRLSSDTETAYAMAIHFGLLTGGARDQAGRWFVEDIQRQGNHVVAGSVGAAYLLPALSDIGRDDVAYRVLMEQSCPSWLCTVKNGASTMWERFDGWTPQVGFANPTSNSLNHYAMGAVGEWLYSAVGGIELDPAAPAGKHLLIRPRPGGGLTHASAHFQSLYGMVRTAWTLDKGAFTLRVSVPANATASITLPFAGPGATEHGRSLDRAPGVQVVRTATANTVVEVESGEYDFAVPAAAAPLVGARARAGVRAGSGVAGVAQ